MLAAMGMLSGAATQFEACRDVSFGGVLCGLPALAENGLFEHLSTSFPSLGGYYTTLQVVTLLAYMALCRIKTVEQLQYAAPGELGKLRGLDRVPEVRCLRQKLTQLSAGDAPEQWAGLLSRQWLEAALELAGTLYVDGHVRLYHGQQTEPFDISSTYSTPPSSTTQGQSETPIHPPRSLLRVARDRSWGHLIFRPDQEV